MSGASSETLSMFFPMWNEEAYIERTVGAAREIGDELVAAGTIADYEIIIVDDASTDSTPQMADDIAAADRHVKVVHHPVNRKLGGSIKTGFASATGELVLYTDADLPFDMRELHKAIRLMRYYDAHMVSAYRLDRIGEGSARAIYTFFYNHITLKSEGSFIDAELVIRSKKLGYHVIQFGVDYFERTRGVSTLSSFSVIRRIVGEMLQLRRELSQLTPAERGIGRR